MEDGDESDSGGGEGHDGQDEGGEPGSAEKEAEDEGEIGQVDAGGDHLGQAGQGAGAGEEIEQDEIIALDELDILRKFVECHVDPSMSRWILKGSVLAPAPVVAVLVVARLQEAGDLLHVRLPVDVKVGQGDQGDQGDQGLKEQEEGGGSGAVLGIQHPGHYGRSTGQKVEELLED